MVTTLKPQERQHYGLENDRAPRDEYGLTARECRLHKDLAHAAWLAVMARRASYAEECAADRANGHRPHYCIHGTNQWVDYDNICGGCEASLSDAEWADQTAHHHLHKVLGTTLMFERLQYTEPHRASVIAPWIAEDWTAAIDPAV
jgi:hypothetical protein